MRTLYVMLMLALAGCASGAGRADNEVAAVVLDERARQAAVETANAGEGSEAALEAAAETAPKSVTAPGP
jgi:uncharacterized metal-binding protein